MIPRYTHPEMGRIWSDQRRYETWLLVEVAAAEAMAEAGLVPAEAAREIRERGGFDLARIEEIEATTQHDVIAFTTAVAERVGPAARWLHFGLTSSDVIDTAQAIQMREACGLILQDLEALAGAVRGRAEEHRRTPMIGRTHGVHAEPTTFGLKLALWFDELRRDAERVRRARAAVSVGKLSGAVGTFAHLDPSIEARVCRRLGLQPAPVSSQIVPRDGHAELLAALAITAASLEKFALEIRGLQKTEIGEVEEPFGRGQKGSSAMPHKRNPIGCEQVTGLARLVRANGHAALENIALWHERDISHSSVERVILPDSFIVLDHMLRRFTRIVAGLVVHPDRMRENLERSRGVVFSGTVLLELARKGVAREEAYAWVQRNAMRSFAERADFRGLLLQDADVTRVLSREEIDGAFDLDVHLRHVDAIFARVFGTDGPPSPRARVFVSLKPSVFDPQGRTIAEALHSLGYTGVTDVRQGKYFELDLGAGSPEQARHLAAEVADRLLANPVIESYRIEMATEDGP
jgi:adenylosuccinate lyase